MEEVYAEIGLIGTPQAKTAALNVYMNVILYIEQIKAGKEESPTREAVKEHLDRFVEVTRQELEVPDE